MSSHSKSGVQITDVSGLQALSNISVDSELRSTKSYKHSKRGDAGEGTNLNLTDLYISEQNNNNTNKTLEINNSIQNLAAKLNALSNRLRNVEQCILKSKSPIPADKTESVQNIEPIKSLYDRQNLTFLSKIANSVKHFQNSQKEPEKSPTKKEKVNKCNFWTNPQVYSLHTKMSDDLCLPKCPKKGYCSLDFSVSGKTKSAKSLREKSETSKDFSKDCPYKSDAGSRDNNMTAGIAYETLAYVLEMLTDRTDTLLKRVMKLEDNITKANEQNHDYIAANQLNCETVFDEVKKQKEEIGDMMTVLQTCLGSYNSLTTDFSQLQNKLTSMSDDIQKILYRSEQMSPKKQSYNETDKLKNRLSKNSKGEYMNKSHSRVQSDLTKHNSAFSSRFEAQLENESQMLNDSILDQSISPNKRRVVTCCNDKKCHTQNYDRNMMSTDMTSLSEYSLDMCTTCTNTTECDNYILMNKNKNAKKKLASKSTVLPTADNNTTYIFCKCLGGPKALGVDVTEEIEKKTQSIQVSNVNVSKKQLNESHSDTNLNTLKGNKSTYESCTSYKFNQADPYDNKMKYYSCNPNSTFAGVYKVTTESKFTQTKEPKKCCGCCAKKKPSENSVQYTKTKPVRLSECPCEFNQINYSSFSPPADSTNKSYRNNEQQFVPAYKPQQQTQTTKRY